MTNSQQVIRHSRESGNPGAQVSAFALDPRFRGGDVYPFDITRAILSQTLSENLLSPARLRRTPAAASVMRRVPV